MADPFQNVDAAGAEFIKVFADSMEDRQNDPIMEDIVAAYLAKLEFAKDSLTVEVGAGAGAVTRRIAAAAAPQQVIGFEPSKGFVAEASARAAGVGNLRFEVADGTDLPLQDASADHLILHTVLTHVTEPAALLREAVRVLKPGGTLVICDADFSKASLSSFENDPLDVCARAFVSDFVTDPHVVGKLRPLIQSAGLDLLDLTMKSRVVAANEQMMAWVTEPMKQKVARGEIGQALADALAGEYRRRMEAGTLYGYQVFATALARKP